MNIFKCNIRSLYCNTLLFFMGVCAITTTQLPTLTVYNLCVIANMHLSSCPFPFYSPFLNTFLQDEIFFCYGLNAVPWYKSMTMTPCLTNLIVFFCSYRNISCTYFLCGFLFFSFYFSRVFLVFLSTGDIWVPKTIINQNIRRQSKTITNQKYLWPTNV